MGFETVVRPVAPINIRPSSARPLAPANVTDQSFAVIGGSGGNLIDLSYSESRSESHSKPKETRRRVDEARVYQKDDGGEVNKDTFIDVEVANKIWFDDGSNYSYKPVQEEDNIEIRKTNVMK